MAVKVKKKSSNTRTFDYALAQGIRAGKLPARSQEARDWYRNLAKKLAVNPSTLIREDRERLKTQPRLGSMYHFFYDPKTKADMPYYDTFPLIFKIEDYSDGFLGINLHYLPLPLRAKLMDALYTIANNERFDDSTKLKISYGILKGVTKFKFFQPCIKRYLRTHVRSRFMEIHSSEWDVALWLPTEQFQKARKTEVWADSRKMVK